MKLIRRLLVTLIVIVVLGYGGVIAYMFVNQRALQYDAQGKVFTLAETGLTAASDVIIDSGGSVVNGWYQAPSADHPVILYYKGNSPAAAPAAGGTARSAR